MKQKASAFGRFLEELGPPATFVGLLGLAWVILLTINIWTNHDRLLWDTWTSFFAMKAWTDGADPYAHGIVPAGTAKYTHYLFPYPPLTLFLFSPFAAIGENFPYVFYVFKLALLGGLVWLWKRYFLAKG